MRTLIIYLIPFIIILFFVYIVIQAERIDRVHDIMYDWCTKRDNRRFRHSIDSMIEPSIKNWFGFKFPKDEDFK